MLNNNQMKQVLAYLHNIGLMNVTIEDILFIAKKFVDMHGHGRRDEQLPFTLTYEIAQFAAMFFMPNVQVNEVGEKEMGIFTFEKLVWYREHVLKECKDKKFLPLFSYYLTDKLPVEDIIKAWEHKLISGIKYYPKGGTTNSENGLNDFDAVRPQLECMARLKIPFNMHGEVPTTDGATPIKGADREPLFYNTKAKELLKWYDGPIVAEHITTHTAVQFVKQYKNVVATIAPQHFLLNDMAIFHKVKANNEWYALAIQLGLFPSMICMPTLKDQFHVNALWDAIIWQYRMQQKKFMLGTDIAYHPHANKYKEGCSCGVFNGPVAIEMYYMVFRYLEQRCPGIMADFQRFGSDIALDFYGIDKQVPNKIMAIVRTPNVIPAIHGDVVAPFAGETLPWKAIDVTAAFA